MYRPEVYLKLDRVMRACVEEISEEFSEQFGRMSGRCIDIGTGPGDAAVDLILPKFNPNSTLLCTDISEPMLSHARKKFGDNKRVSFMNLDIETLELPKDLVENFDHVTAIYSVHWCKDHRQALRNIYKLLRPGGTAFVCFIAYDPAIDAFRVLEAMPQYKPYMKDVDRIVPPYRNVERPRQDVMNLLNDIGFQVEICSCRPMTRDLDNQDSVRDYLLAISPSEIDDMPADLKDAYMKDLTREFMNRGIVFNKDKNNEDDYGVLTKNRLIIISAKKPANK